MVAAVAPAEHRHSGSSSSSSGRRRVQQVLCLPLSSVQAAAHWDWTPALQHCRHRHPRGQLVLLLLLLAAAQVLAAMGEPLVALVLLRAVVEAVLRLRYPQRCEQQLRPGVGPLGLPPLGSYCPLKLALHLRVHPKASRARPRQQLLLPQPPTPQAAAGWQGLEWHRCQVCLWQQQYGRRCLSSSSSQVLAVWQAGLLGWRGCWPTLLQRTQHWRGKCRSSGSSSADGRVE
jgi:hypothetical protein